VGGTLEVPGRESACGIVTESSDLPGASATGDTFRDVPMIKTRSTRSLSSSNARSKLSVSFSPKKVMSGYAGHQGAC
jgi:hypothetical protein